MLHKWSKFSLSFWVALMLIGASLAAVLAAGTYKLAYRLQKGQHLKYLMTIKTDQSMEMMGQEMKTTIDGMSLMHVEVEAVDKDGSVTFVYALDSLRTSVKSPQIDSTLINPEGLIGRRTRQMMSAFGKRISSAVVDTVKLTGVAAQMSGQQASLRLVELPEKEVKLGDSWTVTTADTIKQGEGKIVITPNNTYTVVAEVDTLGYKCVRISYKGTVAIKGDGKNGGMTFFVDGDGPDSGTVYFAPKEGLMVAVSNNSDLELTIALTGQMSMTIPQSTSTKTVVTLVK